jgi:hypothetical protein
MSSHHEEGVMQDKDRALTRVEAAMHLGLSVESLYS